MMRRLASDPVGQTRVFDLVMRLFLIHVLGVRPDCVQSRRHASARVREWCTDGVAASSAAPGIFGPVLAFRGEIEAQGRGSLHPHILVWLLCMSSLELLRIFEREPVLFKQRLAEWMQATVMAIEAACQSSVKALPRKFGHTNKELPSLPLSRTEQKICRYDGGSEIDALKEEVGKGMALTEDQQNWIEASDEALEDAWRRPLLPPRDKEGATIVEGAPEPPRESVYPKPLNAFAVSECPSYRRLGAVCAHNEVDEGGKDLM